MRSASLRRLALALLTLFLTVGIAVPSRASAGATARSAPATPRKTALGRQIDQIIEGGTVGDAFWGVQIRDLESGAVLYEHNPHRTFLPASNEKLLTTSTALDALGADHRYKTTLYFDGDVDGSVLRGTLMIRGSGDPTLGSTEVRGEEASSEVQSGGDPFQRWAAALAKMGVTRIEGRVVGDDDAFADRLYAEGWDVDYVTTQLSRLIGVSTGGMAYGDNLIRVKLRAGDAGEPPEVITRPTGYLKVRNHATTSRRRRGRSLRIKRLVDEEGITLSGSVPSSYAGTFFVPVTNPTRFALYNFRAALRHAGVGVKKLDLVDIDTLRDKPAADDMRPLFVHYSPPLRDILKTVNKESNNFYAEHVFRSISSSGSAGASGRRVEKLLKQAGARAEVLSVRDGSGLSRKDRVTPAAMTKLLAYMDDHAERQAFRASLAHGGEPESTLKYRLKGQPVQAKTGSLEFVRSLSGYATLPDGREVAFCFFANNYTGPGYRITQTFDRIVRAMTS